MPVGIYKLAVLVGLVVILPVISHAQVVKIIFTTEPQTIKSGEISGTITVQLQDSAGSSYKAAETMDVEFLSPSISGEFLSPSSENTVTKTISTGSANKNFRYRDSTNGTFAITVKATGRTSGDIWNANQIIIISDSVSTSTSTTTATTIEETTTANSSSNLESSSSGSSSSHYSAASLSSLKNSPVFEVSAGRDRLGTVGSPLEFKAETNIEYTKNNIFVWSFGDGSEGVGEVITHTYMYPGDYALVLNVSGPRSKAVSRVDVKVIDPQLSISYTSVERIEIINNSKSEANLFGRALVVGDKTFTFPKDTIIKTGQKISFGANVTSLYPVSIRDVFILVLGESTGQANIAAKIEKQKLEQIAFINTELTSLQNKLVELKKEENGTSQLSSAPSITAVPVTEELVEVKETQTALALDAVKEVESSRIRGWFQKIKSFFLGEF